MIDPVNKLWQFVYDAKNGFTPLDLFSFWGLQVEDDEVKAWEAKGFRLSVQVGEPHGLSYDLWERGELCSEACWLIKFQTAGTYCWVTCHAWPDLIALLSQLSTIALASRLADPEIQLPYKKRR